MNEAVEEVVKEWACNTPGGQVRLADLTLEALAELEKKCGTEWHRIVARPRASASNAIHIYAACCASAGCEPAEVTARTLIDVFELVDEDMPEMFQAGIPKAAGGASTSTSPGAPSSSDGPPPKSEN
jgi:hypothetical protein